MVESLVALVVMSLGMLGNASLFMTMLHASRSANSRMQVTNLVADFADRIRANPTAGMAYQGAAANNNCAGAAIGAFTCTPAQMAADDLYQWQQQIAAPGFLGGGAVGSVTVAVPPAGGPNTYTIAITWSEPGELLPLTYSASVLI
jgi:type IV pilus assembly protein PilV